MAINREKVLKEAEKLVQKGKIDAAIRQYEKLLKANPNDVTIINRVGDLYGKVGQVDKAIELYERIAEFFIQDGFLKKAIAVLKKINRMAPQRLDVFERLAELYVELSLMAEAKAQYQVLADWYTKHEDRENALRIQRKLAEVDPGNHVVQLRLADMLMEAGEQDEALKVFSQLIRVLLDRGKLDEAEKLVDHVLDLGPSRGDFIAPVAERFLEEGKRGQAEDLVEKGLTLSPDDPDLKAIQVRLSVEGKSLDELSLEAAESLLRSDPDNDEIRRAVGEKLIAAGEAERAREVLGPLIESALKRGVLGVAQELSEKLREVLPRDLQVLQWAVRAFGPAGQKQKIIDIKSVMADIYYDQGRAEAAQPLYMELADLDPENDLFRQRLLELTSRGFLPGVEARGTGSAGPEGGEQPAAPVLLDFDPEERFGEARVFAKYGLTDKAIRHLEDLLRSYPQHDRARRELVRLLCEEGQVERARQIAVPLEEHYRAESNEEGLAWLREILGAPAGTVAAPAGAEEEEEVLFLDFDEEGEAAPGPEWAPGTPAGAVAAPPESPEGPELLELDLDEDFAASGAPGGGAAGGQQGRDISATGVLEAAGILGEDDESPAPEPASGGIPGVGELDLSWVDDVIQTETGATPSGAWPAAQGGEEPELIELPPLDGTVPPPVEAVGGEAEGVELLDITGVVEGPKVSDLERLDFFITEELFQDAVHILEELEGRFPGDPELAERRRRLKERGVLLEEAAEPGDEPAEELFSEEELYVDLAGELEQELAAEEAMVEEATGHGKDEALLEEVFREFQKGVAEQLSEEDSDTHFNLGIAYKEMGLLAEAIGEFQIAAKNPTYHLESCSMIAVCYVEQGLYDEAVRWYENALQTEGLSEEARKALSYDLGSALLAAGREDEASAVLAELAALDPSYRDVNDLLHGLERQRHAN